MQQGAFFLCRHTKLRFYRVNLLKLYLEQKLMVSLNKSTYFRAKQYLSALQQT